MRLITILDNYNIRHFIGPKPYSRFGNLPQGFGVVIAVAVWAAIGDIRRFAEPKHLVDYAGLGARVHDSGQTTRTGRITKAGRRDLRVVLVEAAQVAANWDRG
jgi:transposase